MNKDNLNKLISYLSNSNDWVTASVLALHLHTSTRTVANYIRAINAEAGNELLILSSAKGYRLNKKRQNHVSLYSLEHYQPETPEERINYIIRNLLYRDNIDISFLLSSLSISERTLETDIIRIRAILKSFQLKLQIHHEHLYIHGKESDRRRLIAECIFRSGKIKYLTLEYLMESFPNSDCHNIYLSLLKILGQFHLTCDRYHLNHLLLFIIIQLSQIKKGNYLKPNELTVFEISECFETKAANALIDILPNPPVFTPEEIHYLNALLFTHTMPELPVITPVNDDEWLEWYSLTLDSLKIMEQYLNIDCTQDNFPQIMTNYFIRMNIRQHINLSKCHPLTDTLRSEHPLLLDISSNMLLFINSKKALPLINQETGDLSLMLAEYIYGKRNFESRISCTLLCPFMPTLAQKICNDLEKHLGDSLYIKQILTTTDTNCIASDSDLTVSLLPIDYSEHTAIISALPKSQDYQFIRHKIQQIKREQDRNFLRLYLIAYMKPQHFETNKHFSSAEDVIHYISLKLQQENIVDESFEEKLLQRERTDTTSFYNAIALPHVCNRCVKRNSIFIVSSQTPISWGNNKVNLIIQISIQEDLLTDFTKVYGILVKMFSKSQNLKNVLQIQKYEDLLTVLPSLS